MDTGDLLILTHPHQQRVDEILSRFFQHAQERAARIGENYLQLWQILEANTVGGKRFRPRMVLLSYESLGGTDSEASAHVAAAFELLHTALIVHDDVIDRDFIRRGAPNVAGRYRDLAAADGASAAKAEHRGMSAAVIAGDLALTNAFRLLETASILPDIRHRLLQLLDDAVFASAAGELIDVDFSLYPDAPPVEEVLRMCRLKTAAYSFEAPLQAGALLAGADAAVVEALGQFGSDIGTAYQMIDDVLGVFGDESATGKTTLGDLREGKRTAMIAYAATQSEWPQIAARLGSPELTRNDADLVRSLLISAGARDYALELAQQFAQRAAGRLEAETFPAALRRELGPVVETVLRRVK